MQVWVLWSFLGYRPKEELLADGAIHNKSPLDLITLL
jgi:hypothetical protein